MQKANSRGLSTTFMDDLKGEKSLLNPILRLVKADDTLGLYIRDEYVNIYYRGGNLLRIELKPGGGYTFHFHRGYEKPSKKTLPVPVPGADWIKLKQAGVVGNDAAVALWLSQVPLLKQSMDFWFSAHPKEEREFQQIIGRVNNTNVNTDYYVVDIEYTSRHFPELRADMIALGWPRTVFARRQGSGFAPRLTMVEVKSRDKALTGKSGMVDHVKKMAGAHAEGRLNFDTVKAEALALFRQQVALGFIDCDKKEAQFQQVGKVDDNVDFLFLFADHDPNSTVLKRELQGVAAMRNLPFNVKVALASPMGFGLFREKIVDANDALAML